jgi:hypothetical protein
MPRQRTKPVNDFIWSLVESHNLAGHKYPFKELAAIYPGLDYKALLRYADINEKHQYLRAIQRDAHALGLTVDEFISRLLAPHQEAS